MQKYLVKVHCPDCGKWICMVGSETIGRIVPYCKRCKANKIIELEPKCREQPSESR